MKTKLCVLLLLTILFQQCATKYSATPVRPDQINVGRKVVVEYDTAMHPLVPYSSPGNIIRAEKYGKDSRIITAQWGNDSIQLTVKEDMWLGLYQGFTATRNASGSIYPERGLPEFSFVDEVDGKLKVKKFRIIFL